MSRHTVYVRRRGATAENLRALLNRRRDALSGAQVASYLSTLERLGGALSDAERRIVDEHDR